MIKSAFSKTMAEEICTTNKKYSYNADGQLTGITTSINANCYARLTADLPKTK